MALVRCGELRQVIDSCLPCHNLVTADPCHTTDSTLHSLGCSDSTLHSLGCSDSTLHPLRCYESTLCSLRCSVLQLEDFIHGVAAATPFTIFTQATNPLERTEKELKPSDALLDVLTKVECERRERGKEDRRRGKEEGGGGGGEGEGGRGGEAGESTFEDTSGFHPALALMMHSLPSDLEKLLVGSMCLRPCAQCQLIAYRVFEVNTVCLLLRDCA